MLIVDQMVPGIMCHPVIVSRTIVILDIKRHSPSILYISASLAMSTSILKTCLVNLISKDTHLVFCISRQTLRCQQAFSKPCLVNLLSKDTHLIFSIPRQALQCQHVFSKSCLVNLISKHSPCILYFSANPVMSTSVLKALHGKTIT